MQGGVYEIESTMEAINHNGKGDWRWHSRKKTNSSECKPRSRAPSAQPGATCELSSSSQALAERAKKSRPRKAADRSVRSTRSVEFERDELGLLLAGVGEGVGIAAGEPLHVSGLEMSRHRALAFDVAADFEISDRDHQV